MPGDASQDDDMNQHQETTKNSLKRSAEHVGDHHHDKGNNGDGGSKKARRGSAKQDEQSEDEKDEFMEDLEDDEQLRFLADNLEAAVDSAEENSRVEIKQEKQSSPGASSSGATAVAGATGAAAAADDRTPHERPESRSQSEASTIQSKASSPAVNLRQDYHSQKADAPEGPQDKGTSEQTAGKAVATANNSGTATENSSTANKSSAESTAAQKAQPKKIKLAFPPNRALMLLQSLPLLDNLSTQILNLISRTSFDEMISTLTDPHSENSQLFHQLVHVFDSTKQLYTAESFIPSNPFHQVCRSEVQKQVLQRANLTSFVCAVFGLSQIGFLDLNEHFLDAFVAPSGRLLKTMGSMFLDLKTQAYISSLRQNDLDKPLSEILDDLFPKDIDAQLARRRGIDVKSLTKHESGFAERCHNRHEFLKNKTSADELSDEYSWMSFLQTLYSYVSKQVESLVSSRSLSVTEPSKAAPPAASKIKAEPVQRKVGSYHIWNIAAGPPVKVPTTGTRPVGAALRSQAALRHAASPVPPSATGTSANSTSTQHQPQYAQSQAQPQGSSDHKSATGGSKPTMSLAEAYLQARNATSTHVTTAHPDMHGMSISSGRPRLIWSREEEFALMDGLDRVQGPYWSQILEYYGPGGSISEVLKNRTQVQLKDKARNLKVFFVKSGIELPQVLQYVTGDASRNVIADSKRNSGANSAQKIWKSEHHSLSPPSASASLQATPTGASSTLRSQVPSSDGSAGSQAPRGTQRYDQQQKDQSSTPPNAANHNDMSTASPFAGTSAAQSVSATPSREQAEESAIDPELTTTTTDDVTGGEAGSGQKESGAASEPAAAGSTTDTANNGNNDEDDEDLEMLMQSVAGLIEEANSSKPVDEEDSATK